jgi:hypothetical protein
VTNHNDSGLHRHPTTARGFAETVNWDLRDPQKFHYFYGERLKVPFPTGSERRMTLWEVAAELSRRLTRIFLRDAHGRRPVYGERETLQQDPHWRDLILFYEYFHGDHGIGLGASHQTGWTALVAKLLQQSGE